MIFDETQLTGFGLQKRKGIFLTDWYVTCLWRPLELNCPDVLSKIALNQYFPSLKSSGSRMPFEVSLRTLCGKVCALIWATLTLNCNTTKCVIKEELRRMEWKKLFFKNDFPLQYCIESASEKFNVINRVWDSVRWNVEHSFGSDRRLWMRSAFGGSAYGTAIAWDSNSLIQTDSQFRPLHEIQVLNKSIWLFIRLYRVLWTRPYKACKGRIMSFLWEPIYIWI